MLIYLMFIDDEDARQTFQKVYEENYLKMYYAALGILKNQMDAENAVHEAFLSIAENFKKYSQISDSKITGLCVTIVKHKAIDTIRKQKYLGDEEIENLVLYNEYADFQPEEHLEQQEQNGIVQNILAKLPEALKIVLVLRYYYGYSSREIAKHLRMSVKAVEMRLYRARAKMRELLNDEEL